MALVKKLQNSGIIEKSKTNNLDLEKKLYDDLYSMSSKDAKRAKPMYDQVAALIRSGAMDKALKFNPDRTYSIDINQLPEELKTKDWTGHEEPLDKDLLGFGSYVRGKDSNKEALTSAMSFLRNNIESKNNTNTNINTNIEDNENLSTKKYSKSLNSINEYILNKDYGGEKDLNGANKNFTETFLSKRNNADERKGKIKNWVNNYLDEYIKDNDANNNSFDFKDIEKAKELKGLLADPNVDWNKLSEKALGLNWRLNDLLTEPAKTQKEVQDEYNLKVAERDARVASTLASNNLIKKHQIAVNHNIIADAEKERIKRAKEKLINLRTKQRQQQLASTSGGATLLRGTGPNGEWTTADKLDAAALAGDATSLGGAWFGIGGGLASTAATLGSDILRGHGLGETLGNVGMNLGFTALSLIPGAASVKMGVKGAKYTAKALKIGNEAVKAKKLFEASKIAVKTGESANLTGKALKDFKKAKAIVNAGESATEVIPKIEKYGVKTLKSIAKKPIEAIVKASPLVKTGLVGYGLVNAGTAARQTAYDVEHGGWGNVSLQDARGLVHGALALKGLRNTVIEHAGTTKSGGNVIQEATKEIKLKNVPEGIESKIIVPKGAKPEVIQSKINEHFDKAINPKKIELETLETLKTKTTLTAEQTSKMESLTKELESLKKGKSEAIVDNNIKERIRNISGKNNKDYKEVSNKTRTIKSEADPRSWYGKKFQEYSIKKLTKGQDKALNSLKQDEKTLAIRKQNTSDNWLTSRRNNKTYKIKELRNTKIDKNLTNKDLEAKVAKLKKVQPKSKPNKLIQEAYNKRLESLTNYKNKVKEIINKKEGGILKYANPSSGITNNGSSYKNTKNKFSFLNDFKSAISNVDKVDLMNAGLYLNTLHANNVKASKDSQAYLNTPLKSLAPNQKVVIYDNSNQQANDAITSANNLGEKQANSTSNMNIGNAARAEMWTKGQELAGKFRLQGSSIINQGLQKQNDLDYKTGLYNLGVSDTNQAAIKSGQSKALMTEGMKGVANNAALNNLLLSFQKNDAVKNNKKYQGAIFDTINDKTYKDLYNEYSDLNDETGNKYYKKYLSMQAIPGVDKIDWEKSGEYIALNNRKLFLEKSLKPYSEKMSTLQTGLAYGRPYTNTMKKGGNIMKKIEADKRLFYKAINGVNELINNNSINLSQSEKESLSSDKLFYMTVLKNNKSISKLK